MSGLDLFEDGFPHSTKEGYDRGCRGHACPGALDHGFSCSEANVRWHGDYAYLKRVEAGLSPAEIAEADRAEQVVKPRPVRMRTKPTVTVKDSVESVEEKLDLPFVPLVGMPTLVFDASEPVMGSGAVEFFGVKHTPGPAKSAVPHGSQAGYQRGCREGCPGDPDTGRTCREAASEYQREYKLRRAANGGQALGRVHVNVVDGQPLSGTVTFTPAVDGVQVVSEPQAFRLGELGRFDVQLLIERPKRENWVVRFARWLGVMPL